MADGSRLERGAGRTLWRQIEDTLASEIARGMPKSGMRFPTEQELSHRFGVNRHTIRRAMAELAARGLVHVQRGRGAIVAEHAIDYAVGPRTRFSENLTRQGKRPGYVFLRVFVVPADVEIAKALRVRPGAPIAVLETLGRADDRPLVLATHHYPVERMSGIVSALETSRTISRALSRAGIRDYRRLWTRVTARPATAEEAEHLHMAPSRPVLITESVNVDTRGLPIEYGLSRFAADRVQFMVETPA